MLVGMMGSGKTSVGQRLAAALGPALRRQRPAGRGPHRPHRRARSSRPTARRPSASRSGPCCETPWPGAEPVGHRRRRRGGARSRQPRPAPRCSPRRGGHVVWLRADAVDRWPGGWTAGPPTAARATTRPRTLDRLDAEREPLYQSVADIVIDEQRGATRARRRRRSPRSQPLVEPGLLDPSDAEVAADDHRPGRAGRRSYEVLVGRRRGRGAGRRGARPAPAGSPSSPRRASASRSTRASSTGAS